MDSNFFKHLNKPLGLSLWVILAACSHAPTQQAGTTSIIELSAADLPTVAAEFITTRTGEAHDHDEHQPTPPAEVSWRFWRENQQITIERPPNGPGRTMAA